jgi:hypothetical protein
MGVIKNIVVGLVGIVILISLFSPSDDESTKSKPTPTIKPAQISLLISDLPSGFKLVEYKESSEGNEISVKYEMGGNYTEFLKNNPTYVGALLISNIIVKFNSSFEALKAFEGINKRFSDEFETRLGTDDIMGETSLYLSKTRLGSRQLNQYIMLLWEGGIVSVIYLLGADTDPSEVRKYTYIVMEKIIGKPITTPPPLKPEEYIRKVARCEECYVKVNYDPVYKIFDSLEVHFNGSAGLFSPGSYTPKSDTFDILRNIYTQSRYPVNEVTVYVYLEFINPDGTTDYKRAMKTRLTKERADKIDWKALSSEVQNLPRYVDSFWMHRSLYVYG